MAKRADLLVRITSLVLSACLLAVLAGAVLQFDDEPGGLTNRVLDRVGESGVEHPVTAVLLNFRAYDTWLEVAVLLLAVWGALVLRTRTSLPDTPPGSPPGVVLAWLIRILIPFGIVTGVYLLWLGTNAPGGAFQAGAVIGATGVLLRLSGFRSLGIMSAPVLRASLMIGFAGFLLLALVLYLSGWAFLQYPPEQAGMLILLVELLITWSVAVSFVALFIAARPDQSTEGEAGA